MKACFQDEVLRMSEVLREHRAPSDLCFALLTGTQLSDRAADTARNIRALDKAVSFDGVIHLGDLLTGNNPERVSMQMLSRELERFRSCTRSKRLYVTAGDANGFRDERFCGQMVYGIITAQRWFRATSYLNDDPSVSRSRDAFWYFADFPDSRMRFVFLYPYTIQIDEKEGFFEKTPVFDLEQLCWLANKALAAEKGWTILLFSHCIPKSRLETGRDPFFYKGHATEQVLALLQRAQRRGVRIGGWFAGHYCCDVLFSCEGISYFSLDSVEPQPAVAACGGAEAKQERALHTPGQDLWDVMLIQPERHRIHLLRFGAGGDHEIIYA